MTERNATIHATPGLLLQMLDTLRFVDLAPILYSNIDRATLRSFTRRSKKTFWISHLLQPPLHIDQPEDLHELLSLWLQARERNREALLVRI